MNNLNLYKFKLILIKVELIKILLYLKKIKLQLILGRIMNHLFNLEAYYFQVNKSNILFKLKLEIV